MSNKKNDSFPHKNASLNTTQLPREPQTSANSNELPVSPEREQAESSPSAFFNKTTLIGVGVLTVALVSVAIPYSLGWFSTPVAVEESVETDPENQLPEEETLSDPLFVPSFSGNLQEFQEHQGGHQGHTANKVDDDLLDLDDLPDFTVDDSNLLETFEPVSYGLTELTVSQSDLAQETTDEEGLLDIPELEDGLPSFEEPLLPQNPPAQFAAQQPLPGNDEPSNPLSRLTIPPKTESGSLDVPDNNTLDIETPRTTFPTSHSNRTLEVQPMVDHSAINTQTVAETVPSRTTFRLPNHDPTPDTTRPIDADDYQSPESEMEPIVPVNYAAQSLTEPPQNAEPRPNPRREYRPRYAQVRQDSRSLPNSDGQLWRDYDITPFTRAAGTATGSRPEQTLVKWIRNQTGEEFWHSEPFGLLSATSDTLHVYHTPEVQEMVVEIVDRFVNPQAESDAYMFRIVSLNGPNWLTSFHANLKPIRIDTPGAQGWLLAKEDYARMIPELARRSDYKELCSPQFPIRSGREYLVSANVPKNYTTNVSPNNDVWPGYSSEMAVIHEGYSMSLIPLSGIDGGAADLMLKCESIQVEKMHSVAVNVPSRVTSRQRVTIESPQVSHFQLDEQIRWPKDRVLVLSLGTIPVPSAAQPNDAGKLIPELSRKISGSPAARGHVLLFVECKTMK